MPITAAPQIQPPSQRSPFDPNGPTGGGPAAPAAPSAFGTIGPSSTYGPGGLGPSPFSPTDTSSGHYGWEVENVLGQAGSEAFRLRDLEEARGQRGEDTLTAAVNAAKKPTLTDDDIRTMYSRNADESAQAMMKNMGTARSALGGSGLDPHSPFGQGLMAQYQMGRVGQNVKSRSDLTVQKITMDALDRARNVQNAEALSAVQMRTPALEGSDFLNSVAGIRLGQQGAAMGMEASKRQADASEKAGKESGMGSIIGGALGAVGSLA